MSTSNQTTHVFAVVLMTVACAVNTTTASTTVTGPDSRSYTVIDARAYDAGSDTEFTQAGWTGGRAQGFRYYQWWDGDTNWGGSSTATCTYIFNGLASGIYDVYISWKDGTNPNQGIADHTGTDGFVTVSFDQDPGNAGVGLPTVGLAHPSSPGDVIDFADLGQVTVTDGTFELTVSGTGDGGGLLNNDAAAISFAAPLSLRGTVLYIR